jgi:hypothetical protein
MPFVCSFCAYLRRSYVAPVLYRTAAGRCGTILDTVLDNAATTLAGGWRVMALASCSVLVASRTSAGQWWSPYRYRAHHDVIGGCRPHPASEE